MDSDTATLKFRQALPFSVLPVSPQLAALHTISQESSISDSCQTCGSYLTTHVKVVRNRQLSRVLTTTCNACGRVYSIPLHNGNSTTFPSRKRGASTLHALSRPFVDTKSTNSFPPLPVNRPSFPSSSSGKKPSSGCSIKPCRPPITKVNNKKSKLHDMLKRNREMEQKRSNLPETSPGGLSAFLTTL